MSDLTIFYILDLSASMEGKKIDTLNHAIEQCNETISQLASEKEANVRIAMMTFADNCDWLTPHGPEHIEDFAVDYFQSLNEASNFGKALYEFNKKLCDKDYFTLTTNDYLPIIIFMTDGEFTDNYSVILDKIRDNIIYEKSVKIAFAIDNEVDSEIISNIVGDGDLVVNNQNELKKQIDFIPVEDSIITDLLLQNINIEEPLLQKNSLIINYDNNDLKEVLSYIKEVYGEESFTDYRLIGYLSDFAPNLIKEKTIIKKLCDIKLMSKIINNISSGDAVKNKIIKSAYNYLIKELIPEETANTIIEVIASVFSYNFEVESKNKKDSNKKEDTKTKKKDSSTKKEGIKDEESSFNNSKESKEKTNDKKLELCNSKQGFTNKNSIEKKSKRIFTREDGSMSWLFKIILIIGVCCCVIFNWPKWIWVLLVIIVFLIAASIDNLLDK